MRVLAASFDKRPDVVAESLTGDRGSGLALQPEGADGANERTLVTLPRRGGMAKLMHQHRRAFDRVRDNGRDENLVMPVIRGGTRPVLANRLV